MSPTRALALAAATAAVTLAAVLPFAIGAAPSVAFRPGNGAPSSAQLVSILNKVDPAHLGAYDRARVAFRTRNTPSAHHNPNRGIGAPATTSINSSSRSPRPPADG